MTPLDSNHRSRLEALEALEKAATDAPWLALRDGDVVAISTDDGEDEVIPWNEGVNQVREEDAALIAEARNLLPALIAVARAAQKMPRPEFGTPYVYARTDDLSELWGALALLAEGDAR